MESPELRSFYLAAQNLREAMTRDLHMDVFDRLCLENYMALVQLTYAEWKRRNVDQSDSRRAA